MPEWLVPNNEGYISFMASKDLFEKFIGVASCVVFRGNEGQRLMFKVFTFDNGGLFGFPPTQYEVDSDHVELQFSPKHLRRRDNFGPNDWSHFHLFITSQNHDAIVKKCGFRLIFKPLENDLEAFLQHNPSLDETLLHIVRHDDIPTSRMEESSNATEVLPESKTSTEENTRRWVEHEDNQTNTEGNSSNEREGLQDCQTSKEEDSMEEDSWSTDEESNVADFSIEKHRYFSSHRHLRNVRPGGEMPEEFVPVEDGTICFMASQDLYGKILGLALCVVFSVEDGQKEVSFDILPHVNGQRRNVQSGTLGSFDSDHVWFQYLKSNVLWGMLEGRVDFGDFGESYLQFSLSLKVSGGTVKKLGYVIRCLELGDDLKVVLENNQLVALASLCEDSPHPADWRVDSFDFYVRPDERREYHRKCHLHVEELEASD